MIIDISQPLQPGMAVFPGDAPYREAATFAIGPGCPVNVAEISMSTHCGSHADAPLHYSPAGAAIGAVPLEPYLGPCRVIDGRGEGPLCAPEAIAPHLAGAPLRILIRLADATDPRAWPTGFRALAPATIALLAEHGTLLVGIDTPSVDPETSTDLPCHMAALAANLRILENLALSHVTPGDYELIALPLRFANLDAAPVRAVLRR